MLVIGWSGSAAADWKLDIGYTALQTELGSNLPTGSGVTVTQVEASSGGSYLPGRRFRIYRENLHPCSQPVAIVSGHATSVASYFYGNNGSIAPGITNIACYEAGIGWGGAF